MTPSYRILSTVLTYKQEVNIPSFVYFSANMSSTVVNKKPIARLIGQLRRVIILLPNISVRQNSPSSGAVKAK